MTTQPDDGALSLPEVTAVLHSMTRKIHAMETLVSNLLSMMVALDPVALDQLRAHDARAVDQLVDAGDRGLEAANAYDLHVERFLALDLVLARAGHRYVPPPTAEIVKLEDFRRRV